MKNNETAVKVKITRIVLSILVVNIAGLALKYFNYDTHVIILGFRFHLSFFLPLLILFPQNMFTILKESFINPVFKRKFIPIAWLIISSALVIVVPLLLEKVELADPDYFYELGLSSVFDYPIYLVWNFPQFILLYAFLLFATCNVRIKFFPILGIIIFLFLYEFIPLDMKDFSIEKISYIPFIELFLIASLVGLFFQFFNNIYWFAILFFSILWINLLAFGSNSEVLINTLFASQYSEWEGFFVIAKDFRPYMFAAHLVIVLITMLISVPFGVAKEKIYKAELSA